MQTLIGVIVRDRVTFLPSPLQSKVSGLIGMTNTSVIKMLSAFTKAVINDNATTNDSMTMAISEK